MRREPTLLGRRQFVALLAAGAAGWAVAKWPGFSGCCTGCGIVFSSAPRTLSLGGACRNCGRDARTGKLPDPGPRVARSLQAFREREVLFPSEEIRAATGRACASLSALCFPVSRQRVPRVFAPHG